MITRPSKAAASDDDDDVSDFSEDPSAINVTFAGRRIYHKWIESKSPVVVKWYHGMVRGVVEGVDGKQGCTYQVKYDSEDEEYNIDHLLQDYIEGIANNQFIAQHIYCL